MEFEELVRRCVSENRDQVIHNASRSHARILFDALFRVAIRDNEPVRIVTGNLNDEFYRGLVGKAKECFAAGMKVEVVVLNADADLKDNSFASVVKGHALGSLWHMKETLSDYAHFVVVGNHSYRFETDHLQAKAQANFNGASVGEVISARFSELKTLILEEKLAK